MNRFYAASFIISFNCFIYLEINGRNQLVLELEIGHDGSEQRFAGRNTNMLTVPICGTTREQTDGPTETYR